MMSFASLWEPTSLCACAPAFPWQRGRNESSAGQFAGGGPCAALCPLRQGAGNRRSNVPLHAMLGAAGSGLSGMGIGAAGVRFALERNLARTARIIIAGKFERRVAIPRIVAASRSPVNGYDVRRQYASGPA